MDREYARLAGLVTRRRKKLARIEHEVITARAQLADAERELSRLRRAAKTGKKALDQEALLQPDAPEGTGGEEGSCRAAGSVLRRCKERASEAGACSEAAKTLTRCAKRTKQRKR